MPRGDKTGPTGDGPLTGRRLGPCYDGNDLRDRRSVGRGLGRGRGFGPRRGPARGLGRGFGANEGKQTNPKSRKIILEEEKRYLKEELDSIEEDLKNL